jgi:protein SCO1/2
MKYTLSMLFLVLITCSTLSAATNANPSQTSLYASKKEWTNQEGAKVKLEDFKGSPVVMSMLFTSCPVTMKDLKAIEKKLSSEEKKQVKFVVISFDPKNDTPKTLKEFAKEQEVNLSHWSFLSGTETSVREMAALLKIKFKKIGDGEFDHSNVFTVLDKNGAIAHQTFGLGANPEESTVVIKALMK